MEIRVFRLTLDSKNLLKLNDAEKIRSYLGNLFWDNPYAHISEKHIVVIYKEHKNDALL